MIDLVCGVAPKAIAKYEIAEFDVEVDGTFKNPFDPAEVAVDGTFIHADGTRIVLPAFWAGEGFKLRFCPTKAGAWSLTTTVQMGADRRQTGPEKFRVEGSSHPGFVRPSAKNRRYFAFDDGKTFFPVGLNLCWPDERGLASYDARFAKLRTAGGNFARIWTTQERPLESKSAGVGRYDLRAAEFYDGVFVLAQRHGVRLMWTFDDYRVLAKTDFFNAHWDKSPYNAANGGPLKEPTDFFADPISRRLYKQKLRYLVARYAAYASVAFWELWNEQDHIPKPGVPLEWFREMTDYLVGIDPYRHPITTSYSWDDKPEVWQSPAVGLVQRHMYGQGDTVDFVGEVAKNALKLDRYAKPQLIGEFGITWKEPDIALDKGKKGTPLHDAMWAALMTGGAGTALTWWWDNYLEPLDLWPVYKGISRFVAPLDLAGRDYQPLPLSADGLTALGLRDAKTGDTILWLHDPSSNWKADAAGAEPRLWSDARVSVPAARAVAVEVWDTRTGEVVSRARANPVAGSATVVLPPFRRDVAVRVRPS